MTGPEDDDIYISDRLEPAHPALVGRLRGRLGDRGIGLKTIRGTKDYWCRDYMPVQVGRGEFVRFRYAPDYLRGHEGLVTAPGDIGPIPKVRRCMDADIVLDGGNVVRRGGRCILTDKVFRENPGIGRADLLEVLRGLLRLEDVVVIPQEPLDVVGHADGVVRFLDDGLVAVSDYAGVATRYGRRLRSILGRAGLEWVELPYGPDEDRGGDIPSAVGCYANFLGVRGLIVVPAFGLPEDEIALRILEGHAGVSAVASLECRDLARGGGVLNCATWTIAGPHGFESES